MSPHPAYVMVSQPSPALPHTLPFISSPESTNTTPSIAAPQPSSTPSGQHFAPSSIPNGAVDSQNTQGHPQTVRQNHHQQQQLRSEAKPGSLLGVIQTDDLPEAASDADRSQPNSGRPILETDGVVSAEVGDVPGILHQDLHPDGQPRRPMNAFMIFARHRRPAIQSKEPGLKTGEISKRLSHDWKNLPDEDKLHYLEQAKLLKDEFHSRFPEYVYKRRPNNTGKRRSSTSQQQLQAKFGCGPGGPPILGGGGPPLNGAMVPHQDLNAHPHHRHLHPGHSEIYQPQSHHLPHHAHRPPPPNRPLSTLTQSSPKMANHSFYAPPSDPSSPRYHQIGHPLSNSNGHPVAHRPHPSPGPYPPPPPRSSKMTPVTANASSGLGAVNSPRSASPGPLSASTPNGVPHQTYMPLPSSHSAPHAQQGAGSYPWFSNEQHTYSAPSHHHQAQAPLSASRSFYYTSWPASGASDSQSVPAPESGPGVACSPSNSDPALPVNPNRAASYSAAAGLYRPPSPIDRARQLSLPSHSITNPSGHEGVPGAPNPASLSYPSRSHQEHQSGEPGGLTSASAASASYGAYPSQEVMSVSSRAAYRNGSVTSGFGGGAGRNGVVRHGGPHPSTNGETSNPDYDPHSHHHHHHHQQHESHHSGVTSTSGSASFPTSNGFGHGSSLLQPPLPAGPMSTMHHQPQGAHNGSTGSVTASVAY